MPDAPDEIEWLDLGPPDRPRPAWLARRTRPQLIAALTLVVVLAAAGTAVTTRHGTHHTHGARPTAAVSTSPSSSLAAEQPSVVAGVPPDGGRPPRTTVVGRNLLGVHDGWELFGRGPAYITRVRLAAGLVSVTSVPELQTGGSVAFLVGRHDALVLPSDFVTGYRVPDGAPAQALSGTLAPGGDAFPGPADGQYWSESLSSSLPNGATLYLVNAAGRRLGPKITLPVTTNTPVLADGSGYVITQGIGGAYDARPGSLRRITTGTVVAVGPTAWLAEECDDIGECSNVLIDKATWTSQVIGPTRSPVGFSPGVVAPDGSRAALLQPTGHGGLRLVMLQVADGVQRTIADLPDSSFGDQVVVFSPDSRWLFVVAIGGALNVYDATTLHRVPFGVTLPPIEQLAIRPAP